MFMHNIYSKLLHSRKFLESWIIGNQKKDLFRDVKTYCMFIGYPRSGHSMIGAILDAHPGIVIGMEADVPDLVKRGYNRNQIFYCILKQSVYFTRTLKNVWNDQSYAIPQSYQGKFTRIEVMGDKKGGKSTLSLAVDKNFPEKLANILQCPVRMLHVIRNPFDNIANMALRRSKSGEKIENQQIRKKIDLYFRMADINSALRSKNKDRYLDIYHEEFLRHPSRELDRIIHFLGITATEEYFDNCSKIVLNAPLKKRFEIDWPPDLRKDVENRIAAYDFLRHYTFEDE